MNKAISFLRRFNIPKSSSSTTPKNILIISTTGIGDTLWGTPAISVLKKNFPDSHIAVMTSPLGHQVLKGNPDIDEHVVIKRAGLSLFQLFFKLKKKKFDTILVFHISFRWIIPFCYFLGPQKLIGFKRHAKAFAHLLSEPYEVGFNHPILQRLSLIQTLGIKGEDHQIKLYLSKEENQVAEDFLKQHQIDTAPLLIGLQPGASQAFKQWPLDHFIKLAKLLNDYYSVKLVIFGSQDEAHLAHEISKEVDVTIASGKLSLRQSAALVSKMHLFVTNDTGPMHLALSQKTPIAAIFSPTAHDLCWPHIGSNWVDIIFRPKTCYKCIGHRCKKPYCMEAIDPGSVFGRCKELLKNLHHYESDSQTPKKASLLNLK